MNKNLFEEINVPEHLPPRLVVHFDGACRNNGRKTARSSFGIFSCGYRSGLSIGKELPDIFTNNGAEIKGAAVSAALILHVIDLLVDRGVNRVDFYGDSAHVIASIANGSVFGYRRRDGLPNSDLWEELGSAVAELSQKCADHNIVAEWHWVPRCYNCEADEMANAALDNRSPDESIQSYRGAPPEINEACTSLIRALPHHRVRAIRTLPDSLTEHVGRTLESIHKNFNVDIAFKIFLCWPAVVSTVSTTIRNREEYKRVLHHITLLSQPTYLSEHLCQALATLGIPIPHDDDATTDRNDSRRNTTLCKRGLHAKLIKDKRIAGIFDASEAPVQHMLQNLFPVDEIPDQIDSTGIDVQITFADLLRTIRHTKKGTAPAQTGWTRELLQTACWSPGEFTRRAIPHFFERIVNGRLDEDQAELLTASLLHPFRYEGKAKPRPITVMDLLTRTAVKIALKLCNIPTAFIADCISQLRKLQNLAEDEEVIVADASNAFNSVKRKPGMQFFTANRSRYEAFIPLINLLYARASHARVFSRSGKLLFEVRILKGTRQGCPSGSLFLSASLHAATETIKRNISSNTIATYADDVNMRGKVDLRERESGPQTRSARRSLVEAFEVAANTYLAECDLDIVGDKMFLVTNHPRDVFIRGRKIRCVSAVKNLGGLITSANPSSEDVEIAIADIREKVRNRISQLLELKLSVQNKLIILRLLPTYLAYYLATLPVTFPEVQQLWKQVDAWHLDAFAAILNIGQIPSSHAPTLYTTIEGGGLGLWPLEFIAMQLGTVTFNTWTRFYRSITDQHKLFGSIIFRQPTHCAWTTWPTTSLSTIPDEAIRCQFKFRFNMMPKPRGYKCPANKQIENNFGHHIISCSACIPNIFYDRHELTMTSIIDTLRYSNIYARRMSKQPLPGNEKGGSDFIVYCDDFIDECDLSIVTEPTGTEDREVRIRTAHREKLRTYAAYQRVIHHAVRPIIANTHGCIEQHTLERFTAWAQTRPHSQQVFAKLCIHTQIGIFKALEQCITTFYARFAND